MTCPLLAMLYIYVHTSLGFVVFVLLALESTCGLFRVVPMIAMPHVCMCYIVMAIYGMCMLHIPGLIVVGLG